MAFEIYKMGKLQDRLESEAYDWVEYAIQDFYDVGDVSELTEEQVDEIFAYAESDDCYESYASMSLRSICDQWYDENGDNE